MGQGPEPPASSPMSESVSGFSSLEGPQPLLTVRTLVRDSEPEQSLIPDSRPSGNV